MPNSKLLAFTGAGRAHNRTHKRPYTKMVPKNTQDRSEVLHQSAKMPSRTAQDRSEVLHQSATMPSRTAAQRGTQDRRKVLHQSAKMPCRTAAQRGTQDCRWCTQDRSEALHESATMPIRTAAQRGTQDRIEILHQSERMLQFVSERLLSGKFSILVSVQLISEQFLSGMERGCQQCTHRSAQVR